MKTLWKADRGSHLVELVASMPIVILIILIIWQFFVAGHALVVAEAAARDAARSAAVGEDAKITATTVAGGYATTVADPVYTRVDGIGCTVRVTVSLQIPIVLLRSQTAVTITRTATMPSEDAGC